MTNPVPVLSDDEVAEIAARPSGAMNMVTVERILLTPAERDALCATVRALRQQIAELTTEWCECGHTKTQHGFFSDHDECYECDQMSDDLCCEWRPKPRSTDTYTALREQLDELRREAEWQKSTIEQLTAGVTGCAKQLAQVTQERDALRALSQKNVEAQIAGVFGDQQHVLERFVQNTVKSFREKAAEWGRIGLSNTYFAGKGEAANELADALEE